MIALYMRLSRADGDLEGVFDTIFIARMSKIVFHQ